MNPEPNHESVQQQLAEQQKALVAIYKSVEQTRKYMLWSGVATIAMFVIPLIIAAIALPRIISGFTGSVSQVLETNTQESLRESLQSLQELGFGQ